jgi:hypothetical protein
MKPISNLRSPLVLRTDFSDNAVWEQICRILDKPFYDTDKMKINYVNDPEYAGVSIAQLFSIIPDPKSAELFYVFIVDGTTISDPTHPLLVVDMVGDPGYTKPGLYARVIADDIRDTMQQFEIANMDIEDLLPFDFDDEAYREDGYYDEE